MMRLAGILLVNYRHMVPHHILGRVRSLILPVFFLCCLFPTVGFPGEALEKGIWQHVEHLSSKIGPRNLQHGDSLDQAASYISSFFISQGYQPQRQVYAVGQKRAANIYIEKAGEGNPRPVLLIGAHYDSHMDSPGADDNASGVAVLLELSRMLSDYSNLVTWQFVAFANEEPPHYRTDSMGSRVFARSCCGEGHQVAGMIALESLGYYSTQKGSQQLPGDLKGDFPEDGSFVVFVGNMASRSFLEQCAGGFQATSNFPLQVLPADPDQVPEIGWSDHWSFWKEGYEAIMITDTAPFRYPHYHTVNDVPEHLDYQKMGELVQGLSGMIKHLDKILYEQARN